MARGDYLAMHPNSSFYFKIRFCGVNSNGYDEDRGSTMRCRSDMPINATSRNEGEVVPKVMGLCEPLMSVRIRDHLVPIAGYITFFTFFPVILESVNLLVERPVSFLFNAGAGLF
eukprot:scaffold2519_cov124-Cylindrotheca_fusiformis.AAC.5